MAFTDPFAVDLASGLVLSGGSFVLGWTGKWLRQRKGTRAARRFWAPFLKGGAHVVLGRFERFKDFERSGLMGVGDANAWAELQAQLRQLGLDGCKVAFADEMPGDGLNSNLILLGGPDANVLTREAMARIPSTLRFGDPDLNQVSIRDATTGKNYHPEPGRTPDEVVRDHMLVLRAANPFSPDKQLLLIAGSYGFGTWAGARLVQMRSFLEDQIVSAKGGFEALGETDVVLGAPQAPRPLVVRSLP